MRTTVLIFSVFTSLCIAFTASAEQSKPARKPNIIFILADDLSYGDLSCFGQKHFSTPNLDRLAAEGRVFSNAYAAGPWCAPSRTGLLTGLHSGHFAPHGKGENQRFNPTVAEMLKTEGYATCALGKWHMREPGNTWNRHKTWEEQKKGTVWKQMPWNRGFDVCRIGYRSGDNPYYPHQLEYGDNLEIPLPQNREIDDKYLWRYRQSGESLFDSRGRYLDKSGSTMLRYSEDIYREEAVRFLRENQKNPFFLYYATPLAHGPLAVPSLGRFKDKSKEWTSAHKFWAAMAEYLDGSVGIILDELKRLGIEQNTILLFASDNGYAEWGYFGRGQWTDDPLFKNKGPWNRGKFINTNGGVIVPFIAWGPGRIPAGRTDRAVNFYDLMATAGELSGANLPGPTDGVSFVPLLEGRDGDQAVRPSMLWSAEQSTALTDPWEAQEKNPAKGNFDSVLLDEKWFAVVFRETSSLRGRVVHVFDITTDPGMEKDLSAVRSDLCERAVEAIKSL